MNFENFDLKTSGSFEDKSFYFFEYYQNKLSLKENIKLFNKFKK